MGSLVKKVRKKEIKKKKRILRKQKPEIEENVDTSDRFLTNPPLYDTTTERTDQQLIEQHWRKFNGSRSTEPEFIPIG